MTAGNKDGAEQRRSADSDQATGDTDDGEAPRMRHSVSQVSLNSTAADTGAVPDTGRRRASGGGFGPFRRRSSQASSSSTNCNTSSGGPPHQSQRSLEGDGLGKLPQGEPARSSGGGGMTIRAPHNRKGSVTSSATETSDGNGGRRWSSSLTGPVVRFVKRASNANSTQSEEEAATGGEKWKIRRRNRRSSSAGSLDDDETSSNNRESAVSSLKSNKTSGTMGTMNFWSKLEKKQDIWDTPDYENDAPPAFSCSDCTSFVCSKVYRETSRILLTTIRNPVILVTVLLTLAVLTAAGCVTVKLLADSYEAALRDDALDRAVETGNWISRELDEALLPLFTLSQFVQHLDDFKSLPYRIGHRGEAGSAPPEAGARNTTHRNVTGICDDPSIKGPFDEIAASIKKDAKMEGVLVNVQLAPYAVVCQMYPVVNTADFPPGVSLNNTLAIGHDLLNDPNRRFIARATVPASGVVIAGPLTLIQGDTPLVKEAFIARLAINMEGYTFPLDGIDYECYGFAVIILNWAALKEKAGFDAAMRKSGMEYRLTRRDVKEDAITGARTVKISTIAKSDRADAVLKGDINTVETTLDTANNEWNMEVGYESGFRPPWEVPLTILIVLLSCVVTCMLAVVLVLKHEMQILLYRMMPPKIIKKLRRGETVVNRYDASTIFFSDVVGFTTLSGSMSPVEVMKMLNDMYTAFDALVIKYDAYKVDTIGDAYIVIGGGPDNCMGREGAEKVAMFALDAIEVVKDLTAPNGARVLIRAGLASGPVVAGVVGTTLPKFTLFGDTVNLASRMESTGVKMKTQCNDMTYRLLRDSPSYDFTFKERVDPATGQKGVYVKGKGETHTWWITGAQKRTTAAVQRQRQLVPPAGGGRPPSKFGNSEQDLGDMRDFECHEEEEEGGTGDGNGNGNDDDDDPSSSPHGSGEALLLEEGRYNALNAQRQDSEDTLKTQTRTNPSSSLSGRVSRERQVSEDTLERTNLKATMMVPLPEEEGGGVVGSSRSSGNVATNAKSPLSMSSSGGGGGDFFIDECAADEWDAHKL